MDWTSSAKRTLFFPGPPNGEVEAAGEALRWFWEASNGFGFAAPLC